MGPAVSADGLGKHYVLGRRRSGDGLRDAISRSFARWTPGRAGGRGTATENGGIWALRDVSFEVEPGQVIGIIGANGAGKSTLLKLLSRITVPTEGSLAMRGRVGSLLEVGTGFHHELTGRENIYLNGAILGMRRYEIARRFDAIVEFAEVQRFVDTPVKHYSDGMYLRLAFGVAAHLEPDLLIVDEVLAVGDARFQKRCLGKMREISSGGGRTVLFVSHNMSVIQRLCRRCLLLERGRLAGDGAPGEVIRRYLGEHRGASSPEAWINVSAMPRVGTGEARFTAVRYGTGRSAAPTEAPYPDGPIEFVMDIDSDAARDVPSLGVVFADRSGARLVNADILTLGRELRLSAGRNLVRLTIDELHLKAGVYDVALWMGDTVSVGLDYVEAALQIEVVAREAGGFGLTPSSDYGAVTCRCDFTTL